MSDRRRSRTGPRGRPAVQPVESSGGVTIPDHPPPSTSISRSSSPWSRKMPRQSSHNSTTIPPRTYVFIEPPHLGHTSPCARGGLAAVSAFSVIVSLSWRLGLGTDAALGSTSQGRLNRRPVSRGSPPAASMCHRSHRATARVQDDAVDPNSGTRHRLTRVLRGCRLSQVAEVRIERRRAGIIAPAGGRSVPRRSSRRARRPPPRNRSRPGSRWRSGSGSRRRRSPPSACRA